MALRTRMASQLCMLALLVGVALHAQAPKASEADPHNLATDFHDVTPILKIGAQAPDFNLPGTDGKLHSLKEYASSKVLAIVFTANHCPIAQMYEQRIKKLVSDFGNRGLAVVAINPNDPIVVNIMEQRHSDSGDTLMDMKVRAEYRNFNFPYLSDAEAQAASHAYGAVATPHMFIFDQQRKLRYQGRIDNSQLEELATKHEARDAIEALLAGRPVALETTPIAGCLVKWADAEARALEQIRMVDQEPVRLEVASVDQMKQLRKNATKKYVLVNFWATWCPLCFEEFRQLQLIHRYYRKREFVVVTVSLDPPERKDAVLAFLNEHHAITKNYLFSVKDPAEAIAAFGLDHWGGSVPHVVLLDMDGKVLYRKEGPIDPLEVRRVILKTLPDDVGRGGTTAYWNSSF